MVIHINVHHGGRYKVSISITLTPAPPTTPINPVRVILSLSLYTCTMNLHHVSSNPNYRHDRAEGGLSDLLNLYFFSKKEKKLNFSAA